MGVGDTCSSRSARDPAHRNARVAPRRKRDARRGRRAHHRPGYQQRTRGQRQV